MPFPYEIIAAVNHQIKQDAEQAGQLTLGDLISALNLVDKYKPLMVDLFQASIGYPHSYRGYYDQLAFEADYENRTVAEVLVDIEAANGETFEGYKGGRYRMGPSTMTWISQYGCTGRRIVGVEEVGEVVVIRTSP